MGRPAKGRGDPLSTARGGFSPRNWLKAWAGGRLRAFCTCFPQAGRPSQVGNRPVAGGSLEGVTFHVEHPLREPPHRRPAPGLPAFRARPLSPPKGLAKPSPRTREVHERRLAGFVPLDRARRTFCPPSMGSLTPDVELDRQRLPSQSSNASMRPDSQAVPRVAGMPLNRLSKCRSASASQCCLLAVAHADYCLSGPPLCGHGVCSPWKPPAGNSPWAAGSRLWRGDAGS
jgi:hypothetical protein